MNAKLENKIIVQGKGDGYMNCYSCGLRMTIKEVAKNRYEGRTLESTWRIVSWCDKCYDDISG